MCMSVGLPFALQCIEKSKKRVRILIILTHRLWGKGLRVRAYFALPQRLHRE